MATSKDADFLIHQLNDIISAKEKEESDTSAGMEVVRAPIQKVPGILRENEKNKINYDPRVVSIGPYHSGNPKLEVGQTLKTGVVIHFASYVGKITKGRKSLGNFFHSEEFVKVAHEARNCYAKGSTGEAFNDDAFRCLMFFDGCFLVYFIHCIVKDDERDDLPITDNYLQFIMTDLFLLENQIPYTVIRAIVTKFMPDKHHNDIEKFIEKNMAVEGCRGGESSLCQNVRDCCKSILNGSQRVRDLVFKRNQQPTIATKKSLEEGSSSTSTVTVAPLHLLDFLRTKLIDCHQKNDRNRTVDGKTSFRSAAELKVAGIKCVTSDSSCIKKIKFLPYRLFRSARLSLPSIMIDDSFKPLWLNLAAYEACPDFYNNSDIASFIYFMDSLIDSPQDVKELRLQGVLQNFLGSDQEVAEMFNDLSTDLAPNLDLYGEVNCDIQEHFNHKRSVWIAEFLHTNCSSPWTVIAFLAAIYVIILTTVQTYYAIY